MASGSVEKEQIDIMAHLPSLLPVLPILTLWCRIFLEKLSVTQLVKKIVSFMEPKGSFSCSKKAFHWTLSWAS